MQGLANNFGGDFIVGRTLELICFAHRFVADRAQPAGPRVDPLTAGVTFVRAQHLTDLRTGMPNETW
jgi:hypothetical protein